MSEPCEGTKPSGYQCGPFPRNFASQNAWKTPQNFYLSYGLSPHAPTVLFTFLANERRSRLQIAGKLLPEKLFRGSPPFWNIGDLRNDPQDEF